MMKHRYLLWLGWLAGLAGLQASTGLVLEDPLGSAGESTEAGHYVLLNKGSGKVLTVDGGSVLNLANIEQRTLGGDVHQLWWLEYETSSGGLDYYNIFNRYSYKVVEVAGGSTADGANILQNRDGSSQRHRWAFVPEGDNWFRVVNQNSGKVLEVAGASMVDGGNIQQNSWTGGDHQLWRLHPVRAEQEPVHDFSLYGFATHGPGVTGGQGGTTVTVTTPAELLDYMQRPDPYIILVSGTIDLPVSPSKMHAVASNKSLLGIDAARIRFGGLDMNGVSNIIIRNITFSNAADDSINIQESSTHIWVDHCNFTDGYDGLLDIKRGSDFITVSWNRFYNHDKTCLLGHDDSFVSDRGRLRVTYHHNWFSGTVQRHPRVRYGRVHVYNNLYENLGDYAMGIGVEAQIISEANYIDTAGSGYKYYDSLSQPGYFRDTDSIFTRIGNNLLEARPGGIDWEPSDFYSHSPDHVLNVKELVTTGAGVGIIDPLAPPLQTYAAWAAGFFSPAQLLDPLVSGPDADPDGDTYKNLFEFILAGGHPLQHNSGLMTIGSTGQDANTVFYIEYTVRNNCAGHIVPQSYDVVASAWSDAPELLAEVSSDSDTVTWRASAVLGDAASLLRLRAGEN